MAKKVLTTESCVITSDDKGKMSLVGKAKEALTTLSKDKIDVTILLEKSSKEDAEKFLKENDVPFAAVVEADASSFTDLMKKQDAIVLPNGKYVILNGDWAWALDGIANKLYNKSGNKEEKSEQQKMNDKFAEYKKWAKEAFAHAKSIG